MTSPAVWPLLVSTAAVTLTVSAVGQRLADWCEANALGVTVAEWRDLNRARLRALAAARDAVRNRPARSLSEPEWAAPPEPAHQVRQNFLPARVHDSATTVRPESTLPVHDRDDPVVVASPAPDDARCTTGVGARMAPAVHAQADVPRPQRPPESTINGRVFMGAKDQIDEFLEEQCWRHVTRSKREVRRSCDDWWAEFEAWAGRRAVVALPEKSFLGMLKQAEHVTRSRPRLRDPVTGRVARNGNGTPARAIFYTFAPPVRRAASRHAEVTQGWRAAA